MLTTESFCADIVEEIVKKLEYDHSTLHSCILANRTWCQVTIPVLWRDPFSFVRKKPDNESENKRLESLFLTCLRYLHGEKALITTLPDFEEQNKHENFPIVNYKTTFNYLAYITHFDDSVIFRSIFRILRRIKPTTLIEAKNTFISFISMLLSHSRNIHSLNISSSTYFVNSLNPMEEIFSPFTSFFSSISTQHTKIKWLQIHIDSHNMYTEILLDNVLSVIEAQKELTEFSFTVKEFDWREFLLDIEFMRLLLICLGEKTDNASKLKLERVEFVGCDFDGCIWDDGEVLFENVSEVVFDTCINLDDEILSGLEFRMEKTIIGKRVSYETN
ncbi:734_t:CDS:1 [Ambispora leptoticha]|uniref:734_t:CDS:1 n=1 Tax=Ambispora leptoticha TaxID=144679 RepID=A0A9N9BKE1_9GLOM|nr:734_t:CDS:1 [Ambispora leptoticha]